MRQPEHDLRKPALARPVWKNRCRNNYSFWFLSDPLGKSGLHLGTHALLTFPRFQTGIPDVTNRRTGCGWNCGADLKRWSRKLTLFVLSPAAQSPAEPPSCFFPAGIHDRNGLKFCSAESINHHAPHLNQRIRKIFHGVHRAVGALSSEVLLELIAPLRSPST
jgi:hypothetical protein